MMATPTVRPAAETLYRQLSPAGDPIWFDPERQPPIYHAAFLPSSQDSDGLSLIRSRFRSEVWAAYRPEQPPTRFRLAHLFGGQLVDLAQRAELPNLHFAPSPDGLDNDHGEPWAHCVAVEINRDLYDRDRATKKRIKEWARAVAASLSVRQVSGPFNPPTEADSYRPWS